MHLEAVVTGKVLERLVERDICPSPPLDHAGQVVVDASLGYTTNGQEGILVAAQEVPQLGPQAKLEIQEA